MPELRFGGGINQLDDELVDADECIDGENFLLDSDSRSYRPRPPIDLKATATNAAEIFGIMQLIKRDDTATQLIQAGTTVYDWDYDVNFTSKGTVASNAKLRGTYWSLDDLLVITDLNKQEVVKTWDGTTFSTLAHNITAVTNLYAKYGIVHGGRVWLFNVKTDSSDNPHVILASEYENYDNFDNAQTPDSAVLTYSDPFFMTSKDLKPINGVGLFFDSIVFSTVDGRMFRITGTDATDYAVEEFYSGSSAVGEELMVNAGNDLIYVKTGGAIESLRATNDYGDTSADDLSKWIQDEVRGMADGIAVYDQQRQRVLFFRYLSVLVLDKYAMTKGRSPWMKWTTQLTTNFDTSAASYIRDPNGTDYTILFGGPAGQIYDMNGTGAGDEGSILIKTYRKSKLLTGLPTIDDLISGRVHYRRKASQNMDVEFEWSEAYTETTNRLVLKDPLVTVGTVNWGGDLYWGGNNYWSSAGTAEDRVSSLGFSAVGKGPSFFVTTKINTNSDFLVLKLETER